MKVEKEMTEFNDEEARRCVFPTVIFPFLKYILLFTTPIPGEKLW